MAIPTVNFDPNCVDVAVSKPVTCTSGVARVQQLPGHLVGVSPPDSRGVWGHAPQKFLGNFRCSEVHSEAF